MFAWFYKFINKFIFFIFAFFLLYIFSFWFGMKLVEPFFSYSIEHPIRNLLVGCVIGSFLSFVITAIIHLVYSKIFKGSNFNSWFRVINLVFLYFSGLVTAIVSMEEFLINNGLVTGEEYILNDQFSLVGIIFFIAIFNYNAYNSLVLTKEINLIDRMYNRYREIRNRFRGILGD